MRTFLSIVASTISAALVAAGIAWAAHIPLYPGPVQGGDILPLINNLVGQVNSQTGWTNVQVGPINSTATTNEQILATSVIPGGTLNSPGQTLIERCGGSTAANSHTKTINLYFGAVEYSTPAIATVGANWELEMTIMAVTATANEVIYGRGSYGAIAIVGGTALAPIATNDTFDNLANNITVKCTVTQGTASASDTTLDDFVVWQEK